MPTVSVRYIVDDVDAAIEFYVRIRKCCDGCVGVHRCCGG